MNRIENLVRIQVIFIARIVLRPANSAGISHWEFPTPPYKSLTSASLRVSLRRMFRDPATQQSSGLTGPEDRYSPVLKRSNSDMDPLSRWVVLMAGRVEFLDQYNWVAQGLQETPQLFFAR